MIAFKCSKCTVIGDPCILLTKTVVGTPKLCPYDTDFKPLWVRHEIKPVDITNALVDSLIGQ